MNTISELIGEILKEKRMSLGLTQEEMGLRVGYKENASKQAISQIERGVTSIPRDKVKKFIEVLKIDDDWLIKTIHSQVESIISKPDFNNSSYTLEEALVGFTGLLAGSIIAKTEFPKPVVPHNISDYGKEELKKLKELFSDGLIDELEYKETKQKILNKYF